MNIETLITDTFAANEHHAPDEQEVFAAAQRRIDRGRAVSRPIAVAAGVAVVAIAASTAVALNRQAPTPANNVVQAATPAPAKTPAKAPAIAPLAMPFDLGWLPQGTVSYLARRINQGAESDSPQAPPLYGGEYMLTVTTAGQVLDVDVQRMAMVSVDEAMFKSGPGAPVTINGRPGIESSHSGGPGGYELYLSDPAGGSMYVNVSGHEGATIPAQQLVDIGRRVAQNVHTPGTTTVTPTFGLRDLPAGLRMCAFDVEQPSAPTTSYTLGDCTARPSIFVGTNVVGDNGGTPGQPVQGHQTRYVDDHGYLTLRVLNAVGGAPNALSGRVPLADLYTIAGHLVLPG
jgi:hypothetical protein